jgi:hypothetical protein
MPSHCGTVVTLTQAPRCLSLRWSIPERRQRAAATWLRRHSLDAIELPDGLMIEPNQRIRLLLRRSSDRPRSGAQIKFVECMQTLTLARRIVVIRCGATFHARGITVSEIVRSTRQKSYDPDDRLFRIDLPHGLYSLTVRKSSDGVSQTASFNCVFDPKESRCGTKYGMVAHIERMRTPAMIR